MQAIGSSLFTIAVAEEAEGFVTTPSRTFCFPPPIRMYILMALDACCLLSVPRSRPTY